MNVLSPDFFAWAVFALVMGCGLVLLGWMLGLNDRDQRTACEMSHLRTKLATTEELLRRSRQHCKEQHDDLHVANLRIRHLQESNQHLALKAVLSTAPEVRRG